MTLEAEHGMLYKVTKTLLATRGKDRRVVIEVGEIIEFRYFSDIHFRTLDNLYCEVTEEEFADSVIPYARILENIEFRNENTLQEILDGKLYKLETL